MPGGALRPDIASLSGRAERAGLQGGRCRGAVRPAARGRRPGAAGAILPPPRGPAGWRPRRCPVPHRAAGPRRRLRRPHLLVRAPDAAACLAAGMAGAPERRRRRRPRAALGARPGTPGGDCSAGCSAPMPWPPAPRAACCRPAGRWRWRSRRMRWSRPNSAPRRADPAGRGDHMALVALRVRDLRRSRGCCGPMASPRTGRRVAGPGGRR